MKATLADAALARQAGRFVWLELDFDKPANRAFVAGHGVAYTPTLFILDPASDRPVATHMGGLAIPELERFLDQGERTFRGLDRTPADAALARADALLGRGRVRDAAEAYRESIRLAEPGWRERDHAVASLTWALWVGGEAQACAETAAVEAPRMPRGELFASVVLAGFASSNQGRDTAWAAAARAILEPLAAEGIALPTALRDHRFQLYQNLMVAADRRGDSLRVIALGHRWLEEIEATTPRNDDERSALDIARKDAALDIDEPGRVIPALIASERAMPANYSASLRLAEVENAAGRHDDALAACARGLRHVSGPLGRSWILQIRADALAASGDTLAARRALEQALASARRIGTTANRMSNVRRITRAIAELDRRAK